MQKLFILLIILIGSCTQYTAVTPERIDGELILNNSVIDIILSEENRQVFIENKGTQLVIEVDYNIDNKNIVIYDILVPNEKLFIYNWPERIYVDVTIDINSVEFY